MRNSRPYRRLVLRSLNPDTCWATRDMPEAYPDEPDATVGVTLSVRNIAEPTTVTDTFPADWAVTDDGGGQVDGNSITFDVEEDTDVAYELAPGGPCENAAFSGTITGLDACEGTVRGRSTIACTPTGDPIVLLTEGDEISFFRGTARPHPEWREPDFNDGDWEVGALGIGYGDDDDMTVLDDMRDGYAAVFGRAAFDLSEYGLSADDVRALRLSVRFDDGFVVSLNGQEFGRPNMAEGPITEQTLAGATISDAPATCAVDNPAAGCAVIAVPVDLLVEGINVLAFSVHNVNLGSSDLSFIPTLVAHTRRDDGPGNFRRGDADGNNAIQIGDAIYTLQYLFLSGPTPACKDACDVNDDGTLNIGDPVLLLRGLFFGDAGRIPPPGFTCGPDPTADSLGNCSTPGC
jgi:hypothetical protein